MKKPLKLWLLVASIIVGLIGAFIMFQWAMFGGSFIIEHMHPVKSIGEWEKLGVTRASIVHRGNTTDLYGTLSWLGICIAAGLSAILLVWEGVTHRKLSEAIYWVLLLVAVPMSLANYWSFDQFVRRDIQVLMNLAITFCGLVCLTHLYAMQLSSTAAIVLRSFIMFFLAMQAVLIPMLYSVLWFLNWQKAISLSATQNFSPGWVSSSTGILALVFSIFQFVKANQPEKPIILRP